MGDSNIPTEIKLLIGTYSGPESNGIYQLLFNTEKGTLSGKKLLAETHNASYLDETGQFIFSVNESNPGSVTAFRWNQTHDSLIFINQQSSEGASPCYIIYHPEMQLLAVANYSSGNLAFYQIADDGYIQENPDVRQHEGSGPILPNQKSPRAHCVQFSKSGTYLYAADLGIDEIVAYPISTDGSIGPSHTALALDPGDGPRHFVFHPSKDQVFIVNELSSSVESASVDPSTGVFTRIGKSSTLPNNYIGQNYCADIHVSSDGKFLYASNRGFNTIAIFSIDETGKLELLANESVRGDWPRNFTLSPEEDYLLVANQNSNNITVFSRDPENGLLTFTGQQIALGKPVCLKFLR